MQNGPQNDLHSQPKSKQEIQAWLVQQIAGLLYVDPTTIDVRVSFNNYGLSSRDAVMLSGDLEEWLDRRLSPTLLYEYPTILALSEYLAGEPAGADGAAPLSAAAQQAGLDAPATARSADERLADLERLSDDEVEALLLEQLDKLKPDQSSAAQNAAF